MKDNLKTYIRLMYSKDSELNSIPVLDDRKRKACELAGMDWDKSQDIVHLKNEKTNEAIFDYLKTETPNDYIKLIADQQLFWEMQKIQMTPVDTKDTDDDKVLKNIQLKNTLSGNSETLLDRINRGYEKIFGAPEEVDMAKKVVRMMRPEERLKKKQA